MSAEKHVIWINNQPIEVNETVYDVYIKGERKCRYFEHDLKTEKVRYNSDGSIKEIIPSREDSLDRLISENAMQFHDSTDDIETIVMRNLLVEKLHNALLSISEKDRDLIFQLFFQNKTIGEVACKLGVSRTAVYKRKTRILKKLKKLLEKK